MKKTVVILQNATEDAEECGKMLNSSFDVLLTTDNQTTALNEVLLKKPNFCITGLALKNGDGINFIQNIKQNSPFTKCIVLSTISHGEIIKQAINAGAVYYMIKPADYNVLTERMSTISVEADDLLEKQQETREIDERISKIFIGMGIPPHIKGYGYLREGVKLAVDEPEIINSVTKRLYPSIGKKFSTSASKVERAIRHAIEVAWNKGRIESINALFGVRAYTQNEKPTNSEFIALIADRLLLDGLSKINNKK